MDLRTYDLIKQAIMISYIDGVEKGGGERPSTFKDWVQPHMYAHKKIGKIMAALDEDYQNDVYVPQKNDFIHLCRMERYGRNGNLRGLRLARMTPDVVRTYFWGFIKKYWRELIGVR